MLFAKAVKEDISSWYYHAVLELPRPLNALIRSVENGLTSIMWSKKGICELELHTPVPSRFMLTSTFVSFVSLFTVAALTAQDKALVII